MEITLFCIYATFTFLIYYLVHDSYDGDHPTLRTIELRLFSWMFFVGLGVLIFYMVYLVPNGSASSLTVYVITNEDWQKALTFAFISFGFIQLGFAIMDAIEYRDYKKSMENSDDEWERHTSIEFGSDNNDGR